MTTLHVYERGLTSLRRFVHCALLMLFLSGSTWAGAEAPDSLSADLDAVLGGTRPAAKHVIERVDGSPIQASAGIAAIDQSKDGEIQDKPVATEPTDSATSEPTAPEPAAAETTPVPEVVNLCAITPLPAAPAATRAVNGYLSGVEPVFTPQPFSRIEVVSIPPLYVSPELPGEGIWQSRGLPATEQGEPLMYKTSYRPSVEFPNAIVHMLILNMKRLNMRLYIGSGEPGGSTQTSTIEADVRPYLRAVTNALWKQKHSGEAGAVYRGNVIKPLANGQATIVVYTDGSVDILEWNDTIPPSLVRDARQLRHLIVKDGKIIDSITRAGKPADSEIGLGMLLVEEPTAAPQSSWWGSYGYGGYGGGYGGDSGSYTSGDKWFIATRSAIGIRKDGNLVFAAGHHISTKDLAKAMVLAGCDRAIHADANPHNVLGNLYIPTGDAQSKRAKLSPEQKDTLNRYDRSYTSDFFGFFLKDAEITDQERKS